MEQVDRLCKQIPVEDPYLWSEASVYDAMTMETFIRKNLKSQGAVDAIQAACRVTIGECKIQFNLWLYYYPICLAPNKKRSGFGTGFGPFLLGLCSSSWGSDEAALGHGKWCSRTTC